MRREVLVLTPTLPLPVRSGGARRTLELCSRAAERTPIRLLCTGEAADRARAAELPFPAEVHPTTPLPAHQAPLAARPERWFHSQALAHRVGLLVGRGRTSVVHVDDLAVGRALPHSSPPIVAHHHKLEPELARALGRPWHEVARLRRLERRVVSRALHHVTCSEQDAERLRQRHAGITATALPCGADFEALAAPRDVPRDPNRLLFLGSLDYGPNQRALAWLLEHALPRWRRGRPELVLEVVGGGRRPSPLDSYSPGLRVVGAVDDLRPHLHRAAALVAPLDVGGGSRVKLAEALAAGCPIVTTPVGAEGLGLRHGEHLTLAEPDEDFVAAVERLLSDPAGAHQRADAGRDHARPALDWDHLADELVEIWDRAEGARTSRQRTGSKRRGVSSDSSSSRILSRNAGTSSASK